MWYSLLWSNKKDSSSKCGRLTTAIVKYSDQWKKERKARYQPNRRSDESENVRIVPSPIATPNILLLRAIWNDKWRKERLSTSQSRAEHYFPAYEICSSIFAQYSIIWKRKLPFSALIMVWSLNNNNVYLIKRLYYQEPFKGTVQKHTHKQQQIHLKNSFHVYIHICMYKFG